MVATPISKSYALGGKFHLPEVFVRLCVCVCVCVSVRLYLCVYGCVQMCVAYVLYVVRCEDFLVGPFLKTMTQNYTKWIIPS